MKLNLKPLNDEIKAMYSDDALETSNTNRVTRGDAGLDLYCPGDLEVPAGETVKIDLKFNVRVYLKMIVVMYVIIYILDRVLVKLLLD